MLSSRPRRSYRVWNEKATEFLVNTRWGRRIRIGLLAGTVVAYPCFSLLTNGPLLQYSFPRRHPIEDGGLPPRLHELVNKEYEHFLDRNSRLPKDAVVRYHVGKWDESLDTVAAGSLGMRTGLEVAVPFFARFTNEEEALQYLKANFPSHIPYLGKMVRVDWDSAIGRDLASTFVLSPNAIRFMAQRDLNAHDGWAAIAQRSISWGTWTSFTSIFTYWLHMNARIFGSSAASFVLIYCVFLAAAWFSNKQWYYLYRYMTDVYADATSARSSFEHCEGGKEYYWKALKRNRLLRELCPELYTEITLAGDIRGIPTSLVMRFDHLKDVNEEDDELKESVALDD